MFEKITKTLSGLAFIKYINSLIDYVNTSDIDATRIKGQLDISNIPPAGLDNVIKVDTVTNMLALTVDDVQNGDTVMIIGVTPPVQYQVVDDTKLGTIDAFQEYAAGTATKALADIDGNNIHTTYGKLAGINYWKGSNYFTGANTFQNLVTMVGGVVFTSGTTTLAWKNDTQIIATINASTYTGNSATATKLATARTITANLASSTAGSFDGSANITVGVTGTLPIEKGGTGATTAAAARTALGCAPAYTHGTTDLIAGSSALTTGTLYIMYE
jgi:hypothetical protein